LLYLWELAQEIPGLEDSVNTSTLYKQIYMTQEPNNTSYSKKSNNETTPPNPKRKSLIRKKPPPLTDIDSPKAETGSVTTDGINFQTNIPLSYALTTENNTTNVQQQKSMVTLGENQQEMPKNTSNQYGPDYWDIIEEDKNLSVRLSERDEREYPVDDSRLDSIRPSVVGYETSKAQQKEGEEETEPIEESFGHEIVWDNISSPEKKGNQENRNEYQGKAVTKPGNSYKSYNDDVWMDRVNAEVIKIQEREKAEKSREKSPGLYRDEEEYMRKDYLIPEQDKSVSISNKKEGSVKQTPGRIEVNIVNNIENIDHIGGRSRSPTFNGRDHYNTYQDSTPPQKFESYITNEPNYIALLQNKSNTKPTNELRSSEKPQRHEEGFSIEETYNIPHRDLYGNSYNEKENTFGLKLTNLQESPERENNYWRKENSQWNNQSTNDEIPGKFGKSDLISYLGSHQQMNSISLLNKQSEPLKIMDLYDEYKSTNQKDSRSYQYQSYNSRGKSFDKGRIPHYEKEYDSYRTDSFNYGSVMTDNQEGDNSRGTGRDSKRWESVQRDVQKLIDNTLKSKAAGKLDKYLKQEREKRLSSVIPKQGNEEWRNLLGKKTEYTNPFANGDENWETRYQSVNQEQRALYDKARLVTSEWKKDESKSVQRNWEGNLFYMTFFY